MTFALQLREEHGKTSVRVAGECRLAKSIENSVYLSIIIYKHTRIHKYIRIHKHIAVYTYIHDLFQSDCLMKVEVTKTVLIYLIGKKLDSC
jgi:hypothetical protein